MAEINPTPWVINTVHPGSRDAVKAFVDAEVQKGIDGKPSDDAKLLEVGKTAIKSALDLLPAEFTHAIVRADGRFTARGIQISINIDGAKTL